MILAGKSGRFLTGAVRKEFLRIVEILERVPLLCEQCGISGIGQALLAEQWHTNLQIKG